MPKTTWVLLTAICGSGGVPATAADGVDPVVACQFMLGKGEVGSGIGGDSVKETGLARSGRPTFGRSLSSKSSPLSDPARAGPGWKSRRTFSALSRIPPCTVTAVPIWRGDELRPL